MDQTLDAVAVLRAFNRSYTQRIGVLGESYLGTGRALGPSRILFEIDADGTPVAELRDRLGLDSGYLSRLLRRLERDELARVERSDADGRQRVVRLTPRGCREQQRLEDRSQDHAAALVEPLSSRLRAELAAALGTAERVLSAATVEFDTVPPDSEDARRALAHYFDELDGRFRSGFDGQAGGTDGDAEALMRPDGAFVLMRTDRSVIACGGVQRLDDETGEIKRMWVDPSWRGLGLGRRLLAHLEDVAVGLGRTRVVLDTNEVLTEAVAMYRGAGYQPIDRYNGNPYAHHWFAKSLSGVLQSPS